MPPVHLNEPFLSLNGGYISYIMEHRSFIDTPFSEHNITQHLITGQMNVTIAGNYPVRITYTERESNSNYFRDYRDVRVEFNIQEFQRIRSLRDQKYIQSLMSQVRSPVLKPSLDYSNLRLAQVNNWLGNNQVLGRLIQAREKILNSQFVDTSLLKKDSAYQWAAWFLRVYDRMVRKQQEVKSFRDSVQQEFLRNEEQVYLLQKLIKGNASSLTDRQNVERILKEHNLEDKRIEKILNRVQSLRALAAGKVIPNYSDLTLKNINVNGVNFEYYNKFYFAFSGGAVDYRARDFFQVRQKGKPQFVFASRFGYGAPEGNHAYLTAFRGKRQLLSSSVNSLAQTVYGLSFESQLVFNRNHKITGEIAQSASPNMVPQIRPENKSDFHFNDARNKAYSLRLNSYFPSTRSRLEAFYQYRGINFQSFSSYYSNADAGSWHIKADQWLWKRKLHLNASVSKNTYTNPYVPVRYDGSMIYKNINMIFKANKLPSLSFGYMPSSQLSSVNGQVYESYYQSFSLLSSHQYKIGLAMAVSMVSYNRFFNQSRDSGFLFYNARYFYFNQHIQFLSYNTQFSISRTVNQQYKLTTLEAGAGATVFKHSSVNIGVRINQLNNQSLQVGLYGRERINIPKIGELSAWIDKAYIPGSNGQLIKNELYSIGLTHFFQ